MMSRLGPSLRRRGWPRVALEALLIVQLLHLGEHLAQMIQLYVLGWPAVTARGVVSNLDVEKIHFAWNLAVLAALAWLRRRGLSSGWLLATLAWAALHTAEHGFLLTRALATGLEGAPGILGAGGWIARRGWTVPGLTTWSRATVHFAWNAVEVALLVLAYTGLAGWRLTWPRARTRLAAERGAVLALVLLIPSTVSAPVAGVTALAPVEIWADGFGTIAGVAVDATRHLYVADSGAGTVIRVAPDGTRVIVARNLDQPVGLAFDAGGRLLIAEEQAGRVVRVEPDGGRVAVATGLGRPRWLAVSGRGIVFISVQRSGPGDAMTILALHPGGRLAVFADDFKNLEGLAASDDTLFAAAKGRRGGVDRDGAIFQVAIRPDGSAGAQATLGPDDRFPMPVGLARDRLGALYLTAKELRSGPSRTKDAIAKVHGDGAVTGFAADLRDPQGLAFDLDGHLYLADGRAGRVLRFRAPPAPTLDAWPGFTNQPVATVTGTTEAGARLELEANGSAGPSALASATGKFSLVVPLAPNVANSIEVSAVAHAGDGLPSPAVEATITHDGLGPAVAFQSPPAAAFVRQTVTVLAQASDGSSGVASLSLSADGTTLPAPLTPPAPATVVTATGSWRTTETADGTHTLSAIASDRAGNTRTATRVVIVDNTAPDTQITGGPSGETESTTATFTVAGTDNLTPATGLTFAWRLDGADAGAFAPETSATFAGLAEGRHTVDVRARDLAGNEDPTPAARSFTITTKPAIASFTPSSGAVGTAVTIMGRGFVPGATQVSFDGIAAVVRSVTPGTLDVTVPIDAHTGPVSVTTPRGTATSVLPFTVTRSQDFAVQTVPASARLLPGVSSAYTISLPSPGGPPFSGLATLSVTGLPLGVTGVFSPAATLSGGQLRTLTLIATPSATPGTSTVTIAASAAVDGMSVTRTTTATLDVLPGGRTAALGQVTYADGTPIPGVRLTLAGVTATSDAGGNFVLLDLPAGSQMLGVDANAAQPGLPMYGIDVTLVAGQATPLAPFRITPPPPPERFVPIANAGAAQVISDPRFPGASLTIPAGVTIAGWDGSVKTKVAIERLSPDALPVPPPPGPTRSLYQVFFGTPMGGLPSAPLPVTVPNDQDLEPGDKAEIWYYDAAPIPGVPAGWRLAGLGTVSADGSRVVSDPEVGLSRFCGVCGVYCIVKNASTQANVNPKGPKAGEPVDLGTGLMVVDKVDLLVPGRLPAVLRRSYSPQDPYGRIAGFELATGPGWTLAFDVVLLQDPSGLRRLILPGNSRFAFAFQPDLSFVNTTYPDFAGAAIRVQPDGSHSLRFKDGTTWRFATGYVPRVGLPIPISGLSLLVAQTDRNGNALTITRDRFGAPTQVTEPGGRALSFTVDGVDAGVSRLLSVTDPIGRVVRYGYGSTAPFRLETVTDPTGGVTRYAYDGKGGIVSITDPRGITFLTNEHDPQGRVVRQTQADGGVWTFAYTGPVGAHTSATVTDPRGHRTIHRMDNAGFETEVVDALGQVTRHARDATGRVTETADTLGRITRFAYDAAGNVSRITDPAGNVRTFIHEPTFSRVTASTDPLGQVTTLDYDTGGNLTAMVDPLGQRTTLTYDGAGQPLTVADPLGNVTRFEYDSVGNLTATIDPLGHRTSREYDAVSRLIRHLNALGQATTIGHDMLNRVETVLDGLGGITRFGYDPNGNVLTVTDARGGVTAYTYDAMDRVATRTDPVGAVESFAYDGLGNPTRHVDRKGQVATFTYDPLNRRTSSRYVDATADSVYDGGGRLVQASDTLGGTILNQYDALDRLLAQTTSLGMIAYAYDAAGRRTTMTAPGQAPVSYAYDAASRPTSITQGGQLVQFQHDAAGRRTRLTLPNQVSTDYQYDAASRLTALLYRNAAGPLGDLSYGYDSIGNRISVAGSFARTLLPAPIPAATYDAANRQLTFGPHTMTYDANGNVASIVAPSEPTSLTWDARNRLVAVATPSASAAWTYDAYGRRARSRVNQTELTYLYDDYDIVVRQGPEAAATFLRSLAIDETLASNATEFYLADAIGSIVALTGQSGSPLSSYTYEPFGFTSSDGATSMNAFQFTGRENDAIAGLYSYRTREYSPVLHRFLTEDPEAGLMLSDTACRSTAAPSPLRHVEIDGGLEPLIAHRFYAAAHGAIVKPQLMHVYEYANSDPVNRRDPLGLRAAPQTPGCDVGGALLETINICARSCCNEHDRCYERASSWCDQSSWLVRYGRPDAYRPDCIRCNHAAVSCILKTMIIAGRKGCPIPNFAPTASP